MIGICLLLIAAGGFLYWQVTGGDVSNPRANFWRVVRDGLPAYSSTPQQGHTVLIGNSNENWREVRNGFIMPLAQWIILIVLLAIGLLYKIAGPDRLEKSRSGIKVERYAKADRILHWYTAVLFITMAVTGFSLILGRLFLIPVIGLQANSVWLELSKVLHNYCGPLLLIGIMFEVILWMKFNIPQKVDLEWVKKMTGRLKDAKPHIGRVNAGQKAWFWLVAACGAIVGITGILLDFPIWGQSHFTMQLSHVIHAVVAILFVGAALGHIYMGSIGVEGVFEGMWNGTVDAVWAEQHADLWYAEKMKKTADREVSAAEGPA